MKRYISHVSIQALTITVYNCVTSQDYLQISNLHVKYDGVHSGNIHLYLLGVSAQSTTLYPRLVANECSVENPRTTHWLLATDLREEVYH